MMHRNCFEGKKHEETLQVPYLLGLKKEQPRRDPGPESFGGVGGLKFLVLRDQGLFGASGNKVSCRCSFEPASFRAF